MFKILLSLLVIVLIRESASEGDQCTSPGRFRHRNTRCKSYYLCVRYQGDFIKMDYDCPFLAIFNPSTNLCSFNAVCIDDVCNGVPSDVNKIPDPNMSNCKSYIECLSEEGERYPVVRKCTVGYFNKELLPEPGCWIMPGSEC